MSELVSGLREPYRCAEPVERMPKMVRVDKLLVDAGHFRSRDEAKRSLMAGEVFVGEKRIEKPGTKLGACSELTVRSRRRRFASRSGFKLEQALRDFSVAPNGKRCLDIGASTGGFTDCLLQAGALSVVAVDVGRGQLEQRLREDPRVDVREGVNARTLDPGFFEHRFDLVVVDVSFISLRLVVPPVYVLCEKQAQLVTLVKPQFEVGRGGVGKGGIVRDQELRRTTIEERVEQVSAMGWKALGWVDCELRGAAGNQEALAAFVREERTP